MNTMFRTFKSFDDFLRVREFLISSYRTYGKPYNWTIERWNNIHFFGNIINGVSEPELFSRIGIWEDDDGEIIGVVNSECDKRGEAYFQLCSKVLSEKCLEEMFDFAEKKLAFKKGEYRLLSLRIPQNEKIREKIAEARGYEKTGIYENIFEFKIDNFQNVKLPDGYKIKTGLEINTLEKGYAHAKAFGYNQGKKIKLNPYAYQSIRKSVDYRPDLDINIISNNHEIVSFCTVWYDRLNRIGILEPVGTIPESRNKGLGKAAVYEAINRIYKEGAQKVYVISHNLFYKKIGFQEVYRNNIWEKKTANN